MSTVPRTFYYSANSGVHYKHPDSIRITVRLISGGGGGMGSETDMSYGSISEIPYHLYGGRGGDSCWDAHPNALVTFDGPTVHWANHGKSPDHPIFFTSTGTLPAGMDDVATVLCLRPHDDGRHLPAFADSIRAAQCVAASSRCAVPGAGTGSHYATAYRYIVQGAGGGGIIGDQGCPNGAIGFYNEIPHPRSFFIAGASGGAIMGGGGAGGNSPWGGGAGAQIMNNGNAGTNMAGGGGSGGGHLAKTEYGPCGGAGGGYGEIECELKPAYYFIAGAGGAPGANGGEYAGGPGGNGVVIVKEYF
jgi:hypothetical protein